MYKYNVRTILMYDKYKLKKSWKNLLSGKLVELIRLIV